MTSCLRGILVLGTILLAPSVLAQEVAEVIFHGNHSISDREMAHLARINPGTVLGPAAREEIRDRLMRTGRFESVEIRVRRRGLADTGPVIIVVMVKEKPSAASKLMFLPILKGNDEYGITFGGRFTAVDLLGAGERLSVPLTWGGERRVALEGYFDLEGTPLTAAILDTGITRKENPHFKIGDLRKEVRGALSKRWSHFELQGGASWTDVSFGSIEESFFSYRASLVLDTRQDELFPGNAVMAGLGWERMNIRGGREFNRFGLDLRGYRKVSSQALLAGQFLVLAADGRLPDYQRPFLGGASTLRGHEPGAFIGDTLVTTSLELRLPVSSRLAAHKAGFAFFWDSGAVLDHRQSIRDADFKHGVGAGAFFFIAGFGIRIDWAHSLLGSSRVHFSTGFRF